MKNYFQLRHNNNQQQLKGERFYFSFYQENLKVHEGIGRRRRRCIIHLYQKEEEENIKIKIT